MFAVVRHPDVSVPGIYPAEAMEVQLLHGWYRVSEWTERPGDLDLADYGPEAVDLDAPQPVDDPAPEAEAEPKTRKPTAKPAAKQTEEK